MDFCEKKMFDKSIPGVVEVSADKKTGTGSMEIKPTGPVSIGSLLYVARKTRYSILGPINNMGMAQGKCGLKFELSKEYVKIVGRGALTIGVEKKGAPCKGIVGCLLAKPQKCMHAW